VQNCGRCIENYCLKYKNLVGCRGLRSPDPPPGALPLTPRWGLRPQTSIIGSRSRARHGCVFDPHFSLPSAAPGIAVTHPDWYRSFRVMKWAVFPPLSTGNCVEPSWATLFTTVTTGSSVVGFLESYVVGTSHCLCHLDFFTVMSLALGCRNPYEDQPYCNHAATILPRNPKIKLWYTMIYLWTRLTL